MRGESFEDLARYPEGRLVPTKSRDETKKPKVSLYDADVAKWYTCLPAGRRATLKMFYVYILKSLNFDKFYKGLTNNIDRRLNEHFSGKCQSTKLMLPLVLVHVEICNALKEARDLEKFFKSGYGREIVKEISLINAEVAEW